MNQTTRREFLQQTGALAASAALFGCQTNTASEMVPAPGELGFKSATELIGMLERRQIGSEELTQYFIDRIEKYDATLNAVVVRDFDRALEAARAADAALARGEVLGRLHGLPMTIKEAYDVAGLPTTWGHPDQLQNVPQTDAVVVERLKAAGAHFLGKTNVPIDLGDFQSYNDVYGTTNNPWDLSRTPGGSSGGSAVALASGMTGLESGSDIGGSIRNPAHFCGVYGHKPTWGTVPSRGHQPPGVPAGPNEPDLAVVGPMARSAEDLALAMEVVSGPDVLTSPGWRLELPPPRKTTLEGLRVAVWPDDPAAPVHGAIVQRTTEIADRLASVGARVSDTARPAFSGADSHGVYLPILTAVTSTPHGELTYGNWVQLNGQRAVFRSQWQEFFSEWDVLICPITATTAFPQDQSPINRRTVRVNGEPRPYWEQLFWASLPTLSYLPSTVFPTGLSEEGLPIGLQAIGAEFNDRTTIEFARLIAHEIRGFEPPPGYGD